MRIVFINITFNSLVKVLTSNVKVLEEILIKIGKSFEDSVMDPAAIGQWAFNYFF